MERYLLVFLCNVLFLNVNAQKKYEIIKIDTISFETLNVIYIKKNTLRGDRFYRIMTNKKYTGIKGNEKIQVGDKLKIKLIKADLDISLKSTPLHEGNEISFFYKDIYKGKKVNVDYFTEDIIDLYYIPI